MYFDATICGTTQRGAPPLTRDFCESPLRRRNRRDGAEPVVTERLPHDRVCSRICLSLGVKRAPSADAARTKDFLKMIFFPVPLSFLSNTLTFTQPFPAMCSFNFLSLNRQPTK